YDDESLTDSSHLMYSIHTNESESDNSSRRYECEHEAPIMPAHDETYIAPLKLI
ncbi:13378_t:CDS:2, partial [Entrophospora sp. SA101]